MGIGVSYIGNGERREFELDGVPPVGSLAADVLGMHPSGKMNFLQFANVDAVRHALPVPEIPSMADSPNGALHPRLGGSITEIAGDLCLRGEEGGIPGGNVIYGSKNGQSGFFTIGQFDEGSGGIVLNGEGDKPDGSSANLSGGQGATIRIGGRTDVRVDEAEDAIKWLVVKEYYRMAELTPNGRIRSISPERERLICRIILNSGGAGNGKYGVRAFVSGNDEKPAFDFFAFGKETDLDTWDENEEKFACNYDEDGNPLDDPPVRIAMVDVCNCPTIKGDDNGDDGG